MSSCLSSCLGGECVKCKGWSRMARGCRPSTARGRNLRPLAVRPFSAAVCHSVCRRTLIRHPRPHDFVGKPAQHGTVQGSVDTVNDATAQRKTAEAEHEWVFEQDARVLSSPSQATGSNLRHPISSLTHALPLGILPVKCCEPPGCPSVARTALRDRAIVFVRQPDHRLWQPSRSRKQPVAVARLLHWRRLP